MTMNYNYISELIANGFDSDTIVSMLEKYSPKIGKKIKQLLLGGYGTSEILKYISKNKELQKEIKPSSSRKAATSADRARLASYQSAMDVPKSRDEQALEKIKRINPYVMSAIGAITPYAIPELMGAEASTVAQSMIPGGDTTPPIPGSPINPPQGIPQSPGQMAAPQTPMPGPQIGQQIAQGVQQPIAQGMQPATQAEMGQAAQAMPQPGQQLPSVFEELTKNIDVKALSPEKVKQLQFVKTISDKLEQEGKPITDPAFQGVAKKIKSILQGKPGTVIEETARIAGTQPQQPIVQPQEPKITSVDAAPIQKPKDVAKGDTVVTKDGNIAEVKGISGNNFLIEEDGKIKQVPMDELRSQPEAIKKAKIIFDPSKVLEEDKSAAIAISIPIPDRSGIINMFHDGSFYLYKRKDGKPLEEDLIRRIIDGQDIPLTSGETFMGAWNNEKGDSRGSASFKELVAVSQDSSKEDDPSKPLMFTKITDSFTHGYLKEFQGLLKETTRQSSAKPKKEKKKSK